ncbi:bifunctional diguanylate cyclase/phosphodiesterase [Actinotalea sp. Marseille-Q4924]|uniref:putative bifunctional diguanylate cyclase/phosphodiesterase n=1 Tax=Actinotalea sp. Marseille-Q4924 TaxID=2866571 RepID=UPI001CE41E0A|nr:EAL domain-containing protein [Actinotalea sp. Marseille-Q4924]
MDRADVRLGTGGVLARVLDGGPWAAIVAGVLSSLVLTGEDEAVGLVITLTAVFGLLLTRVVLTAHREPHRRLSLLLLGGGVALWSAGSAWVSVGRTLSAVTFPAPGEILCVLAYLALAAFLQVDAPRRVATSAVAWTEAGIVCGAAVCLAGFAVLAPLSGTGVRGGLALLLAVLFPLINLVLSTMVIAQMVLRQRDRSVRTLMLALGFLGIAVADSSLIGSLSTETYTASVALQALWGASFAALVAAGCRAPGVPDGRPDARESTPVLVTASGLALVVLVLDPWTAVGWVVRVVALLTLLAAGVRMTLALREARGAAEAMRLSLTDELTGLPNRRSLLAATDRALEAGGAVGVLLLDLDGFKDVNDSLGHAAGDEVLLTLAQRLRRLLPPSVLVARLGGDEFAVLAPGADAILLLETAQRLRQALAAPVRVDTMDLAIDASVGIALHATGPTAANELLRRADIAMYEAKQSRVGALLFDPSLDGLAGDRLRRGEELRYALTHDQLVLQYQPQVDARTRQVVAFEALVRWQHPQEGLLGPAAFLPDVRRVGLMTALTEKVLLTAVADLRRWLDAGLDLRVAVNWAPEEVVAGALVPTLVAALTSAGVPAERLTVEVTEDSFLAEPDRARQVLLQLRSHGVQVSIDDYGSGFSSLAYLRDLPVQELKMDRSFVARVDQDDRSRLIVQTTTQMARAMNLRMVAEGVEDAAVAAALLPLGVDILQGYHIARPMPADEVGAWVARWRALVALQGMRPGTTER